MTRDERYLEDIVEAIVRIEKYTAATLDVLDSDELVQTWVVHHLQIIGEAARELSPELKDGHPEVPWRQIIGMRHILVHQYFAVNLPTVRDVVANDLPVLKGQTASILDSLRR